MIIGGRDKFNKSLQYACKTLSHHAGDAKIVQKSARLSSGISTARKVDRLLWSLVDIQEALDYLSDEQMEGALKAIAILGALCSAYHWYTENMIFLSKIKALDNVDIPRLALSGGRADLVGCVIGLYLLSLNYAEEKDDDQRHLKKVKFFGMILDTIHALDDSGVLLKIIGRELNSGEYGVVGLLSAVATLYRCWNS